MILLNIFTIILDNRIEITEFCREYFPEHVKAEMWLNSNKHKFKNMPLKPAVVMCDNPDFTEQIEEMLENTYDAEKAEKYQSYYDDYCCYKCKTMEDFLTFVNGTSDAGIKVPVHCDHSDESWMES